MKKSSEELIQEIKEFKEQEEFYNKQIQDILSKKPLSIEETSKTMEDEVQPALQEMLKEAFDDYKEVFPDTEELTFPLSYDIIFPESGSITFKHIVGIRPFKFTYGMIGEVYVMEQGYSTDTEDASETEWIKLEFMHLPIDFVSTVTTLIKNQIAMERNKQKGRKDLAEKLYQFLKSKEEENSNE